MILGLGQIIKTIFLIFDELIKPCYKGQMTKTYGNDQFFLNIFFFGLPHSATFIFIIFRCVYVIASIVYIHAVYGAAVEPMTSSL
jgi:hypothetical protein